MKFEEFAVVEGEFDNEYSIVVKVEDSQEPDIATWSLVQKGLNSTFAYAWIHGQEAIKELFELKETKALEIKDQLDTN